MWQILYIYLFFICYFYLHFVNLLNIFFVIYISNNTKFAQNDWNKQQLTVFIDISRGRRKENLWLCQAEISIAFIFFLSESQLLYDATWEFVFSENKVIVTDYFMTQILLFPLLRALFLRDTKPLKTTLLRIVWNGAESCRQKLLIF